MRFKKVPRLRRNTNTFKFRFTVRSNWTRPNNHDSKKVEIAEVNGEKVKFSSMYILSSATKI